jgi:hypothetical protein
VSAIRTQLLLGVLALLGPALAGVVVLAVSDAPWGLVVALVIAGAAVMAVLIGVGTMLLDLDGGAPRLPGHRGVALLFCIALATLVVGVGAVVEDAVAADNGSPDASAATRTVRNFLAVAALDQNGYVACGLLTPAEQSRVARSTGQPEDCRVALSEPQRGAGLVSSAGALERLRLHAAVSGARAWVTVDASGRSLRVGLARATSAETSAFQAPAGPWRIASGAAALLAAR